MFAQLSYGWRKRQRFLLIISVALHLFLLASILRSPAPIFVAPSLVTKGDGGTSLARIYYGGSRGVTQAHPVPHIFTRPATPKHQAKLPPLAAKMQTGNAVASALARDGAAAGSLYGSLSYGPLRGLEVRPALPIVSFDPVVNSAMLNGEAGDVIIEITIDSVGNITDMRVLQSFNPVVDQQVIAAVEKWHFAPATRDGMPIPSKQDVHYHFPR
jgi:TonB family protein